MLANRKTERRSFRRENSAPSSSNGLPPRPDTDPVAGCQELRPFRLRVDAEVPRKSDRSSELRDRDEGGRPRRAPVLARARNLVDGFRGKSCSASESHAI